jgi:hypothetical protein
MNEKDSPFLFQNYQTNFFAEKATQYSKYAIPNLLALTSLNEI